MMTLSSVFGNPNPACLAQAEGTRRLTAYRLMGRPGRGTLAGLCCRSLQGPESAGGESTGGSELAAKFSQYVMDKGFKQPQIDPQPSHLMAPTTVIEVQMDALQRNDWPDTDSGMKTAFAFTKPPDTETSVPGQAFHTHARSWFGKEEWLDFKDFVAMVNSSPYNILVNCERWKTVSELVFPSRRAERAVQAIEVVSREEKRSHRFTFLLERIQQGPYKGCWMTYGVRYGDYGNC